MCNPPAPQKKQNKTKNTQMNLHVRDLFLIGMCNVEGSTSVKTSDPQLQNILYNFSIICFVET